MYIRPTWLEVSLSNLRHNYRVLRDHIMSHGAPPDAKVFCVIKGDCYGLGAVPAAWALKDEGADYFAVATIDEAVQLREAGIQDPVLVLGPAIPEYAETAVRLAIRCTVTNIEAVKAISDAAVRLGKKGFVHIAIDTGMGRIGYMPGEAAKAAKEMTALPGIFLEGAFTHFSTADEADLSYTHHQHDLFMKAIDDMKAAGIEVPIPHCCNSGGTVHFPQWAMGGVRPGHLLSGLYPSLDVPRDVVDIRPCMSVKTRVADVRTLPAGSSVSYGRTYTTSGTETFAVLPIGYADGFQRTMSNKADVLIRGKRCPIAGRICMDQCLARVDGDVEIGDEVVLLGRQGSEEISVDEFAEKSGWITAQVACGMSKRLPRVYVD